MVIAFADGLFAACSKGNKQFNPQALFNLFRVFVLEKIKRGPKPSHEFERGVFCVPMTFFLPCRSLQSKISWQRKGQKIATNFHASLPIIIFHLSSNWKLEWHHENIKAHYCLWALAKQKLLIVATCHSPFLSRVQPSAMMLECQWDWAFITLKILDNFDVHG